MPNEKDSVTVDQLGENIQASRQDKEGLSTPEAESGGDFVGSGEMDDDDDDEFFEEMDKTNTPTPNHRSTGNMMYEPDYNKIDTGTTGRNSVKDINLEKQGSGEAE